MLGIYPNNVPEVIGGADLSVVGGYASDCSLLPEVLVRPDLAFQTGTWVEGGGVMALAISTGRADVKLLWSLGLLNGLISS